jgi:hypothetical protein
VKGETPQVLAARLRQELARVRQEWLARHQAADQAARAELRHIREGLEEVARARKAERN